MYTHTCTHTQLKTYQEDFQAERRDRVRMSDEKQSAALKYEAEITSLRLQLDRCRNELTHYTAETNRLSQQLRLKYEYEQDQYKRHLESRVSLCVCVCVCVCSLIDVHVSECMCVCATCLYSTVTSSRCHVYNKYKFVIVQLLSFSLHTGLYSTLSEWQTSSSRSLC